MQGWMWISLSISESHSASLLSSTHHPHSLTHALTHSLTHHSLTVLGDWDSLLGDLVPRGHVRVEVVLAVEE